MIQLSRETEFPTAGRCETQSIQWQWLPFLLLYSAIWFYGLWCLIIKIV
jgi:hypothetical protein